MRRGWRISPGLWVLIAALALVGGVYLWELSRYAEKFGSWPLAFRHMAAGVNCDAARRVGLAPALAGRPGYWPDNDRDKDGSACEPYTPDVNR